MATVARIALAEVLGQLRSELTQAQQAGGNERLQFEVQEAELEFYVEVSKEATPGAKVKIDVLAIGGMEAGSDVKLGQTSNHRITLKLSVVDRRTERNARIAAQRHREWDQDKD
ncbi:trypco2 family protein [Allorhizocola rhizosphaerae]|uniref:trypco2 family protein n=1 Tax=Allorhizocola rhizosphaerae TaxID=1872709 RepID=UPI0013C33681|nr:trypco2 family protein [Allorhizocola rhizosphaerae]